MHRAVICDGVKVGADAVISEGCVLSFNCVVSPGHRVPPHTRITLCTHLPEEGDSDHETEGPTGALDADSSDDAEQVYGPLPAVLQARLSSLISSVLFPFFVIMVSC